MISNFTRDISFFQSLSESNSVVTYKDFDKEINNLVEYLNRKVVTSINSTVEQSYNGIVDNTNYILKNIGNGKIVFSKLEDVNYINNSIELTKFKLVHTNSLLFVNKKNNIGYLKLNVDNFGVGGIFKDIYKYNYSNSNKISGYNFEDRAIKSDNIDINTISKRHISQNGIDYLLSNLLVKTNHIVDLSLGNNKFGLHQITASKLHSKILELRNNSKLFYKTDSISDYKIKNNSFDFKLIGNNRVLFGNGLLHKNTIPLNSVKIDKPSSSFPETIDPYKLCVYSIKRAYKVVKYEQPVKDHIYKNSEYISLNKSLKNVQKQIIQINNINNQLIRDSVLTAYDGVKVNYISYLNNYNTSVVDFFTKIAKKPDSLNKILYGTTNEKRFEEYKKTWVENKALLPILYKKEKDLVDKIAITPINIYKPQPPLKRERLELVPDVVTYSLIKKQDVIKSYHLGATVFNINNFLDRITCPNVKSEKFINKNSLDDNLRTLLGI
jgi:hypothetical protein